jgi:hypothetical protein
LTVFVPARRMGRPCGSALFAPTSFEYSTLHTSAPQLVLLMVIERFKNGDAKAVYRRFRDHGRLAPEGLNYLDSWVDMNFDRCFQIMECADPKLLELWAARWRDLVEFEFVPVITSKAALAAIVPDSLPPTARSPQSSSGELAAHFGGVLIRVQVDEKVKDSVVEHRDCGDAFRLERRFANLCLVADNEP